MPSIFERPPPPPFVGAEALDNHQAARVAALLATTQAHSDLAVAEHVAMAEYVVNGPAAYLGFWATYIEEPVDVEPDRFEVTDADGRTLYDSGIGDE